MSTRGNGTREARMADRVARLEAENAALRDLLEAVRETAAVPWPADMQADFETMLKGEQLAASRIASWLAPDGGFEFSDTVSHIRSRADLFRAHMPIVTYAAKEM